MAHRARLVLGRLVVSRTLGTLRRKGVTLQTQQVDIANPEEPWIGGTVGGMTTAAAFGLHRHVFVNKGPLLIRVAFVANRIATGHGSHLADRGGAMNVVAIAALEQALGNPVVIGFGEIGFGRGVASIAQVRLFLDQQLLGFLGVMRGMAVEATNVVAGMG